MKMNTLGKGSEACVLKGKAARLSTGGQTTQVQNLCKRNHEESLKLYCAVPYPVFYPALVLKNAFVFMAKC